MTTAQTVASMLGDDGQRFETDDCRELADVSREHGARVSYARCEEGDYITGREARWIEIYRSECNASTATRYLFSDGSAIVVRGGFDAWDLEGSTPFSWAGLE